MDGLTMTQKFIEDEAEVLREAFRDSVESGKVFNVISWKKKREKQRTIEAKLKKMAGF